MEPTTGYQGTDRPDDLQAVQAAAPLAADESGVASPWTTPDAHDGRDAPAPPPVWVRYIDSRLKQFCTR